MREPQPVVADASRVEADDEPGSSDAISKHLEIGLEVRTSTLFAAFDEHEDSPVVDAALFQRANRSERSKGRIAVVCGSPPIDTVADADRSKGRESVSPRSKWRLFVEVAVDER